MLSGRSRSQVFLDSTDLLDLSSLLSDGVADADVLLLLGTEHVLTRPWCLLECFHAASLQIPILLVDVKGGGFSVSSVHQYINELEQHMGIDNPEGLELLRDNIGEDLSALKKKMHAMLSAFEQDGSRWTTFNPSATDPEMISILKDIIEAMAAARGSAGALPCKQAAPKEWRNPSTVKWTDDSANRQVMDAKATTFGHLSRLVMPSQLPVVHIVCNSDEGHAEARVLQTELAVKLRRRVSTTMTDGSEASTASANVVVMLTKNALHDPELLARVYRALSLSKRVIPICLIGRGYDHREASLHLRNLASKLSEPKLAALRALLEDRRDENLNEQQPPATVEDVQALLAKALPQVITVDWKPDGSQNALEATVANVVRRLDLSHMNTDRVIGALSPAKNFRGLTNIVTRRLKSSERVLPRSRTAKSQEQRDAEAAGASSLDAATTSPVVPFDQEQT